MYANFENKIQEVKELLPKSSLPEIKIESAVNINEIIVKLKHDRFPSYILTVEYSFLYNKSSKVYQNYSFTMDQNIEENFIAMSVLNAEAASIYDFIKNNYSVFESKILEVSDAYAQYMKYNEEQRQAEYNVKELLIEQDIIEVCKYFKKVTDIDELISYIAVSHFGSLWGEKSFYSIYNYNASINVNRKTIEVNKNKNWTFRLNNHRVSKSDIMNVIADGIYYIDSTNENVVRPFKNSACYKNKECLLKNVKEA